MDDNLNLVGQLTSEEIAIKTFEQSSFSPDDGKYKQRTLEKYLSQEAEWKTCAFIQLKLLETRKEMGLANEDNLAELEEAFKKFNPINAALIEQHITKHDQLAVIEELGRYVPKETKALFHPGTTSYDILDTARSYLLKKVYKEVFRPIVSETIKKLTNIAEQLIEPTQDGIRALQVGRTHLQDTSPVPFGATFALYAARLADRLNKCDLAFSSLKGKISGIVGTGASVEMVVGKGKQLEFEKRVLDKLGLEPDYTATQIVQKENLADVGNSIVTLMRVLGDFANDMRILYSSAIGEVTSRTGAARLGGSSADASKNNPINWENISGKVAIVESGMRVLYDMIQTDLQRDLRGSVQARYQPNLMIVETFESFVRANKELDTLSINEDKMSKNLEKIRKNPSEALVAILRGEAGWVHPKYGVGHDFVKEMAKKSKEEGKSLMEVCFQDKDFIALFNTLSKEKQEILNGELEKYVGTSFERARINIDFSRMVISKK